MWLLYLTQPYGDTMCLGNQVTPWMSPHIKWELNSVRSDAENENGLFHQEGLPGHLRASHMHLVGLGCRTHYRQLNLDTAFNQTQEEASIPALQAAVAKGWPPYQPAAAHRALDSGVLPNHCWQSWPPGPKAPERIISLMCYSKWITNNGAGPVTSKVLSPSTRSPTTGKTIAEHKNLVFPNSVFFPQIKTP